MANLLLILGLLRPTWQLRSWFFVARYRWSRFLLLRFAIDLWLFLLTFWFLIILLIFYFYLGGSCYRPSFDFIVLFLYIYWILFLIINVIYTLSCTHILIWIFYPDVLFQDWKLTAFFIENLNRISFCFIYLLAYAASVRIPTKYINYKIFLECNEGKWFDSNFVIT